MPKHPRKESTTLEPPHRTNAKGRHQFFGRVFTGRTVGWTGGLGDVSKLRCWQYCIGKVFVTIRSDIRMQRMETCLNTEREGGPVDWHPQCPREDWDFVACSTEEHQSPAVWFTSTEETLRHYSTLVLLQSTTHRSRQIFLSSSRQSKAV